MAMRFKNRYDAYKRGPMDASMMAEDYIESRPDYHDGQLEALGRKVEAIAKLVGFLAQKLDPEDQRELAALLCYDVVEEERKVPAFDAVVQVGEELVAVDFKTTSPQDALKLGRSIHERQAQGRFYRGAIGLVPMPEMVETPEDVKRAVCQHKWFLMTRSDKMFERCSECGTERDV